MTQQLSLLEAHPNVKPLRTARIERDVGIQRAIDHAETIEPDWGERAYQWIRGYAMHCRQFISEECTALAAKSGIESPADPRAWGHPFKRAAREGVIQKVGYGISNNRHRSPTPLWRSLIYVPPRPAA